MICIHFVQYFHIGKDGDAGAQMCRVFYRYNRYILYALQGLCQMFWFYWLPHRIQNRWSCGQSQLSRIMSPKFGSNRSSDAFLILPLQNIPYHHNQKVNNLLLIKFFFACCPWKPFENRKSQWKISIWFCYFICFDFHNQPQNVLIEKFFPLVIRKS